MTDPLPDTTEDAASKLTALHVLCSMGWKYLTPGEVDELRGGRRSSVLLEPILLRKLGEINRVNYRQRSEPFTEGALRAVANALREAGNEGLMRESEKILDLLQLGKSVEQTIEGDTKSFTVRYVDWDDFSNNAFHVAEEFSVERTNSATVLTPDLVLFVNGIPFGVIECKRTGPKMLAQAVEQHLRNQLPENLPGFFRFAQVLLALAVNEASYGTVGTSKAFWSSWVEEGEDPAFPSSVVNAPFDAESQDKIFSSRMEPRRERFLALLEPGRLPTAQDLLLIHLCRPERLLSLVSRFTLFDEGVKKVARSQQYFAVTELLSRVRRREPSGARSGGVVWHTQGSGKSLTMVMLAKALLLAPDIPGARVVLVTDRVDLDDQIWSTFRNCGVDPVQASTGAKLTEVMTHGTATLVTTLIQKFRAGMRAGKVGNPSDNIFVLVDEAHRSQAGEKGGFGEFHAEMRRMLPRACFIGFTGTPLTKAERATENQFGGIVHAYTIDRAERDGAVLPLLYEGRETVISVNADPLDRWVDRVCEGLTDEQSGELKARCSRSDILRAAENRLRAIAWDVSEHFSRTWKGTPFKGQLVTRSKLSAVRLKRLFEEFGKVSVEVLISPPDEREGVETAYTPAKDEVSEFWAAVKARYGNETNYNKQVISSFKTGESPEIIIVVDKLITGFDAPRNTVLYLDRGLQGHTLLQAIARVNRVYPGKDHGYVIDYEGVLGNLDAALSTYEALSDFSNDDLGAAILPVGEEIRSLLDRHARLLDLFRALPNRSDNEAYEQSLADDNRRDEFYRRLNLFSRTLILALSSLTFREATSPGEIGRYRADLKYFQTLRSAVLRRYSDSIDFADYEPRIRKHIDANLTAGDVEPVTPRFSIFDQEAFRREVDKLATPASKADTIASRTLRTITEKWEEDRVFYAKFSDIITQAIADFRAKRIADLEFLRRVQEASTHVRMHTDDAHPRTLDGHHEAKAVYNLLSEACSRFPAGAPSREVLAESALAVDGLVRRAASIVAWTENHDALKRLTNGIEDILFDLRGAGGPLFDSKSAESMSAMDVLLDDILKAAKRNYANR